MKNLIILFGWVVMTFSSSFKLEDYLNKLTYKQVMDAKIVVYTNGAGVCQKEYYNLIYWDDKK